MDGESNSGEGSGRKEESRRESLHLLREYKDNHEQNGGRTIYMKVVSGEILDRKGK